MRKIIYPLLILCFCYDLVESKEYSNFTQDVCIHKSSPLSADGLSHKCLHPTNTCSFNNIYNLLLFAVTSKRDSIIISNTAVLISHGIILSLISYHPNTYTKNRAPPSVRII